MYCNGSTQKLDFKNPQFKDLRFFFNKNVCFVYSLRVELIDPDDKLNPKIPKVCFANYTPSEYDERIVDMCLWSIEQEPEGITIVVKVYLQKDNKNQIL